MAPEPLVSLFRQQADQSLSLDSSFRFHCHEGLDCFNRCCRTPTIVLSPYDILQLKNFLGLTAGEFLERYTLKGVEERSNLPLIFINAYGSSQGGCPFVGPEGCTVYTRRPAACRLFPITMGSQLTEQGLVDYYFCRRLEYCRGFEGQRQWTVASWQASQGFGEYDRGRREWMEILLQQGQRGPGRIDPRMQALVATMAYDLDQWRGLLADPAWRRRYNLAGPDLEAAMSDDLALLRLSYRCLQTLLFGGEAVTEALEKGSRR